MYTLELKAPLLLTPVTIKFPICEVTSTRIVAKSDCMIEEDADDMTVCSMCHLEGVQREFSNKWYMTLCYYHLDTMYVGERVVRLVHTHCFIGSKLYGNT